MRIIDKEGRITPGALSKKRGCFDRNDIPVVKTVDRERRFKLV
jgi:hypothetical protein